MTLAIIPRKNLFLAIGALIVLVSVGTVAFFGLKPGIEFTGGSLLEVQYGTSPEKVDIEAAVAKLDFGSVSVRQSDAADSSGYFVRTRDLSDDERSRLEEAVLSIGTGGQVTRFTSVGPVIGAELADKAVWAIGAVLLLIIIYVAIAFSGIGYPVRSWVYGVIAVLVLGHDILVPIAAMSVLGYFAGAEVDILFVTALLTILGFSVNDTIVIFDRVREKLVENRTEKRQMVKVVGGMPREEVSFTLNRSFGQLVAEAISETMARSINTSLTVLLALVALFVFGGEVTQDFALVLIVGVIAGAYSSIFIASPMLVWYEEYQAKKQSKKKN